MLNLKFPEVKRFHRAAATHLEAARELLDECPENAASLLGHDVVYLAGYVVECGLKALLLSQYPRREHEEVVEWFRTDVKHNLERLREELTKKGVNFPRDQLENLRQVHRRWWSEMRYDAQQWKREDVERLFQATEAIYKWVRGG